MDRNEILDKIRRLREGEILDDAELGDILEANGCYSLLSKMPLQKIKTAVFAVVNNAIVKVIYKECEPVFAELKDIPYAVIKGAVLSEQIYGSPALRKSGDIDLLIVPENLEKVKDVLKKHGFIQGRVIEDRIIPYTRVEQIYQKTYTHQAAAFVKATDNRMCPFVNVDVNLDIFWGESKVRADMREFLSHTEKTQVCGVEVNKLTPVYECISLCMHHYKDLNSLYLLADGVISLSLFCDIDGYFTRVQPKAKEFSEICGRLGVVEYIAFCLWHTNNVFPSETLKKYLDMFVNEKINDVIKRIGLCDEEYKILDGGISGWIFNEAFKEKFNSLLTEKDRAKIELNRKYM